MKRLTVAIAAWGLVLACGFVRPSRVAVGIGIATNTHPSVVWAAEEINRTGGIGGVPLQLVGLSERGAYSPVVILETAARFNRERDLVAVIGHSDSASTLSAAPSYNRDRIPQIVTIATNPAITNIGSWTYRLCLSDAAQGPALATYAVREWQKHRIAILYVNDDYGRGLAQFFEQRTKELGAEIVTAVLHRNQLQADDREAIQAGIVEMKARDADLVALFQRVEAARWTVQAIRSAGLQVDILGSENLAQYEFARAPGGITNGVRVSQFLDLDHHNPRVAAFVQAINKAAGRDPDYADAFAYDALYLLRDAVTKGGYSRDGVKRYLDRLVATGQEVHGVSGTFALGGDHDARRPLYISTIEDGRFRVLKALATSE